MVFNCIPIMHRRASTSTWQAKARACKQRRDTQHVTQRWYIAVPRKLPFSYHRPQLWTNYSYEGTRDAAFAKAVQLFTDEEWLDDVTVMSTIEEREMSVEMEEDGCYDVDTWHARWASYSAAEQQWRIDRCKRSLVDWCAEDEYNCGVIAWDEVPDEGKQCWGDDVLEVVVL